MFTRYIVLHDASEDGVAGEFSTLKEAKDCAGTVGLIVVPLHEVNPLQTGVENDPRRLVTLYCTDSTRVIQNVFTY